MSFCNGRLKDQNLESTQIKVNETLNRNELVGIRIMRVSDQFVPMIGEQKTRTNVSNAKSRKTRLEKKLKEAKKTDTEGIKYLKDAIKMQSHFIQNEVHFEGAQREKDLCYFDEIGSLKQNELDKKPRFTYSFGVKSRLDTRSQSRAKEDDFSTMYSSPQGTEFAAILTQHGDDWPLLYNLAHTSRKIPATYDKEVKYPSSLFFAWKLIEDLGKFFRLDLDLLDEQTSLDDFF